jgi:hypothetical protein
MVPVDKVMPAGAQTAFIIGAAIGAVLIWAYAISESRRRRDLIPVFVVVGSGSRRRCRPRRRPRLLRRAHPSPPENSARIPMYEKGRASMMTPEDFTAAWCTDALGVQDVDLGDRRRAYPHAKLAGPGSGMGMSRTSSTPGPPKSERAIAYMGILRFLSRGMTSGLGSAERTGTFRRACRRRWGSWRR